MTLNWVIFFCFCLTRLLVGLYLHLKIDCRYQSNVVAKPLETERDTDHKSRHRCLNQIEPKNYISQYYVNNAFFLFDIFQSMSVLTTLKVTWLFFVVCRFKQNNKKITKKSNTLNGNAKTINKVCLLLFRSSILTNHKMVTKDKQNTNSHKPITGLVDEIPSVNYCNWIFHFDK